MRAKSIYVQQRNQKNAFSEAGKKQRKIAQITRNQLITATDLVLQPKVLERSGVLIFSRKPKTVLPEFMEITDLRAA